MSEELTPYITNQPERPRMSKPEAKRMIELYSKLGHARRYLLLEMFERSAHVTMGYPRFDEYCRIQLGIDRDKSHIYQTLKVARVERAVSEQSIYDVSYMDEIKTPKITFAVAAILGKAPEDKWKPIYDKFAAMQSGDVYLPNSALKELKHLVAAAQPPISEPAAIAPEPPRPKPNMTPIVPPTYDRGPEHDDDEDAELLITEQECIAASVPEDTDDDTEDVDPFYEPPSSPSFVPPHITTPTVSTPEGVLCASLAFLRMYAKVGHSDELWCDVCAFVKEYGK